MPLVTDRAAASCLSSASSQNGNAMIKNLAVVHYQNRFAREGLPLLTKMKVFDNASMDHNIYHIAPNRQSLEHHQLPEGVAPFGRRKPVVDSPGLSMIETAWNQPQYQQLEPPTGRRKSSMPREAAQIPLFRF
jgi:hypothetical protein